MQDIFISINKNVARLSTVDKDASLRTTLIDVSKDVVNDTKIVNSEAFAIVLNELLPHITTLTKNKVGLNFVIEPQDVYLRFITLSKKDIDIEAQIITELKEKAKEIPLNDIYFSYKKIAPFVYQFTGVRKDILEKYIEVSNNMGVGLKSVVPWVRALPKYEKVNEPSIFICKTGNRQVIALSELGGIFFADVYEKELTGKELQVLIKDLSFYKRSSPISHVFTINADYFTLEGYKVREIAIPKFRDEPEITQGYEQNVIVGYIFDTDPEAIDSQLNLLNLLPLPVVEEKSFSLVAAGTIVALFLLIGGLVGGYLYLRGKNDLRNTNIAQNTNQKQDQNSNAVLSGSAPAVVTQKEELKKSDIKIRIENGAGIDKLARKTELFLTALGYSIQSIDTANSDVADTIFRFKKDKVAYTDLIKADMKDKFPGITVKEDLPDTTEYDLLITVGRSSKL
ncbi:LytR C-terminal domain-containing protein [Patescibacteria group bacterium]|nr:LytR C-terminal domain-containing protein [Patescibacteria group bacterium]MBU1952967.1 LytR C-terminal domain-containing protein [Patescibacteria group bacterium]